MVSFLEPIREINFLSIIIRFALAVTIGGIIGLERGRKNRPAGFRTYMLVCLGATLVMMTNQYVAQMYDLSDPVRMGAQVISGIGFLGAGTIIVTGKNQVKGITTAAGLWTAACCGLAIGIGFYEGAVIGGLCILLILTLMSRLEAKVQQQSQYMELYIELDASASIGDLIIHARENSIEIFDLQTQKNKTAKGNFNSVVFSVRLAKKEQHNEVIEVFEKLDGILYLEELQS